MGSPFTAQQRRKVKHDSRACVWDNIGRCIGIQILCAVPYVLLLVILYATLFGRVFALLAAGYTDNYILGSAAAEGLNSVWGVLFVMRQPAPRRGAGHRHAVPGVYLAAGAVDGD